jgi:hypothetical protein
MTTDIDNPSTTGRHPESSNSVSLLVLQPQSRRRIAATCANLDQLTDGRKVDKLLTSHLSSAI